MDLVESYRNHGVLLDIGTGDGYFLNFAAKDFEVVATEVSAKGIEYATSRGHHVHPGTIFDDVCDDKKFDVIPMWHVLEHLSEPGIILHKIKSLLKENGFLFIAVPNEVLPIFSSVITAGKIHPFGKLEYDREIHLTHFTPTSLSFAMRKIFKFKVPGIFADDVHVYKRSLRMPFFM